MTGVFGRDLAFDLLVHNDNAKNAPTRAARNDARKALGMEPEEEDTRTEREKRLDRAYSAMRRLGI